MRRQRPLVSVAYRARVATAELEREQRLPRPLVSVAYRARVAAAQAAAEAGGTPAPLKETVVEGRWQGRPLLGMVVRTLALAFPIVSAVVAAMVSSRAIERPSGARAVAVWFGLVTVISTAVLLAVERVARRLLPLAALLRLSMAFPDRAPSRFSVAFKAGTTRDLKVKLAEAKERGADDEVSKSAERILTLVGALSAHDRGTRGHSERVRAFNDLIAEEMRLPPADLDRLRWAALLHDVGKLDVPHRILNKPGQPTDQEWVRLRRHPTEGAKIAAPLFGWLGPWSAAIEQHHERWDGGGYPRGLSGADISVAARIVAVADTFEVITAPRPYKRPVNAQAAREELARCAGSHFDPAVVRAFLNISIGRLRMAMGPISWLAQLPFLGSVPRLEGLAMAAGRSAVTAAGTATGVGALALTGMVTPASSAASHAGKVHLLEDAARITEQVQGAVSASTSAAAAAPPVATPPAAAPHVAPQASPGSTPDDGSEDRADEPTGGIPTERNAAEATAAPQAAAEPVPSDSPQTAPVPEPAPAPEPPSTVSPSPDAETGKEFEARQRADKRAFDALQREERKDFGHQQAADERVFDARQAALWDAFHQIGHTREEEKAFDDLQDVQNRRLEHRQDDERQAFEAGQDQAKEQFEARQAAERRAFYGGASGADEDDRNNRD